MYCIKIVIDFGFTVSACHDGDSDNFPVFDCVKAFGTLIRGQNIRQTCMCSLRYDTRANPADITHFTIVNALQLVPAWRHRSARPLVP